MRRIALALVTALAVAGCSQAGAAGTSGEPIVGVEAPRKPWQLTLDLDLKSGYAVTAGVADGSRQSLSVRSVAFAGTADGVYGGEVTGYDPGAFDAGRLGLGEPVTLSPGQDATYVASFVFTARDHSGGGPWQTPAVGWRDASGLWILVYGDGTATRDDLIRLAAAVRVTPARDLRTPFRLGGPLPAGLELSYVRSPDNRLDRQAPMAGLGAPGRLAADVAVHTGPAPKLEVTVSAQARDARWAAERAKLGRAAPIAGRPAWYAAGTLTVEGERCIVRLRSDRRAEEDLTSIARRLTVGDCTDPESWIPPLA